MSKHAAMVPMVDGTRTEHMVVYYNTDWEDLPCLVEAPLEYLRGQQFNWSQDSVASVAWQLLTPLTATFECGYRDLSTFVESLSLLKEVHELEGREKDVSGFDPDFFAGVFKEFEAKLKGSFLVRFSAFTNAIRVLYFPPALSDAIKQRPRYYGGFAQPTVITTKGASINHSSLHFDLTESSHRMRADFIVRCMEHPDELAEKLTMDGPNVLGVTFGLTGAANPHAAIAPIRDSDFKPLPVPPRFVAGVPSGVVEPYKRYEKYPRITAHNLSEAALTPVCNDIKCPTFGNTYYLGDITVESYLRTMYDPAQVISSGIDTALAAGGKIDKVLGPIRTDIDHINHGGGQQAGGGGHNPP